MCPGSLEQNGVVKRKKLSPLGNPSCLAFHLECSQSILGWFPFIIAYLMNHMPSWILGFKYPLELLFYSSLVSSLPFKVLGCISYMHFPKSGRPKLDPKSLNCIFLCYAMSQKGCKCYHLLNRRRIVTIVVTFPESVPFFKISSGQFHL